MKKLLVSLVALFALIALPAAVDKGVCSFADAGSTCNGAELIANTNEELSNIYKYLPTLIGSVTNSGNDYSGTATPALTSYDDGAIYEFKPSADNTGASQINLNSLGLKALVQANGTALVSGDILATTTYIARYYAASNQVRILTPPIGTNLTTKGDILTHNGSSQVRLPVGADGTRLVADSAATNGIKWDKNWNALTSDVTNNNAVANTIQDVTGLSFSVTSGKSYWFRFSIGYTAAAPTTGSRWSINGPAITTLIYKSQYSLTTTTVTTNEGQSTYDQPAASNATSAATAANIAVVEGVVTPSASGTVIARFASEVSGSAIVAKIGSFVQYQQIN